MKSSILGNTFYDYRQRMERDLDYQLIVIVVQHIFHLFRIYSKVQGNEFKLKLATTLRGLERKISIEAQEGEGRIKIGKTPISHSLYVYLNEFMLQEDSTKAVFGGAFMTMTWNLVCRASDTSSIHLHCLEWTEDSLRVFFAHMNNNQTGERKRDSRHI